MTRISMSREVMLLEMTMVLCSFLLGLAVGPWMDKQLKRLETALARLEKKVFIKHRHRDKEEP